MLDRLQEGLEVKVLVLVGWLVGRIKIPGMVPRRRSACNEYCPLVVKLSGIQC